MENQEITPNKELIPFGQAVSLIEKAIGMIPARAGVIAVNFVKERFRQQNWLDKNPEPWKKRKPPKNKTKTDNRALLVKSGRLRRSFRKVVQGYRIIIATDVPYARQHNEGGTVPNRRGMNITVEKRQFIGESENLNERINKMIHDDINEILKKIKK